MEYVDLRAFGSAAAAGAGRGTGAAALANDTSLAPAAGDGIPKLDASGLGVAGKRLCSPTPADRNPLGGATPAAALLLRARRWP